MAIFFVIVLIKYELDKKRYLKSIRQLTNINYGKRVTIESLAGQLRESRATVREKLRIIANNCEAISVKDASIFSLSKQLEESTATIAEKSRIIDQQGTDISVKDVSIYSLFEQLEESSVTIAERTSIIDQRDLAISENGAKISELDSKIDELNSKISSCEDSISEESNKLYHALRESSIKTAAIKSLEKNITDLIRYYE